LDRAGESPDGQRLLDLHGVSETPLLPLEAMARIVQSFDEAAARPASQEEAAIAYRKTLDGKRVLLVLDNARDDAQVMPLLKCRAPTTRIIVTSRRTITAEGINVVALDEMPPDHARSFLLGIIGEERGTDPEIARLVRRCGRLPLALRVAGRFLKGHPGLAIGQYLAAVDQAAVDFTVSGEPDTDVRAVLGLSARALAREESALAERWQLLAVFPDEFDRDGAAAVWEVEATTAGLQLSELAARSMVMHDDASRRWRLHDLMRDVAQVPLEGQDQAALEAQLEAARARHAQHYCGVLEIAGNLYLKGGKGALAALALYDLDQRNIATGQRWSALNAKSDETAVALAAAFGRTLGAALVLRIRLHPRERINWLEAQRSACIRLGDRQSEGNALGNLGTAWMDLGETRRAIEFHEQALKIAREIGDRIGEGSELGSLGTAWGVLGETRRAIEYLEQGLGIMREIGNRRGEGATLGNLGIAWRDLGEPRRAIEYYEQQLEITREISDREQEGNALGNLGIAAAQLGELLRSIDFFEQQLEITREIGDRRGEGHGYYNSALALDALGERTEAVRRAQKALALYEAIGAKHSVAMVRAALAAWGAEDGRS
jgi:tetratricopeptide (TPR) repeat protein